MRVEPGGGELLRLARAQLLEALLPHLPAERHYEARMIASAMAIAARELQAAAPAAVDAHRLAGEIRAGRHDDDAAIAEKLRALTRERLAVSNPRVMEGTR